MNSSGLAITRGNRLRLLLIPALFAGVFLACTAVLAAEGTGASHRKILIQPETTLSGHSDVDLQ